MTISEIHHIGITVSDLDRSVAFYRDMLGFRTALDIKLSGANLERLMKLQPGTKSHSVILQQGSSLVGEIELGQFSPPPARSTGPKRPGDPGIFLISFEVKGEELETVCERLKKRGVQFYSDPEILNVKNYGSVRSVIFEDPDGIMIELIHLPPREEVHDERKKYHAAGE